MDAFEHLVLAALDSRVSLKGPSKSFRVESVPQSRRGDVRATVEGGSVRPDVLAAAAGEAGIVERWEVEGPWLYVTLPVTAMVDAAAAAVLGDGDRYGAVPFSVPSAVQLRFSDPNLNKPLHIGHLRNNFLGMALSGLYADAGAAVERVTVHSDWGRHIAQTVVAVRHFGGGATPESAGVKGDHFVGGLYARFHNEDDASLHEEVERVLRAMHEGDEGVRAEASRLTRWAEVGIDETYARIGSAFDAVHHESRFVEEGLAAVRTAAEAGTFATQPDGAVVAEVERDGRPAEAMLLRPDGTPVFVVATLGIDVCRSIGEGSIVQVAGSEWRRGLADYLQVLARLDAGWLSRWRGVYYGMVELPEGRMQSRAGRVVDADAVLADLAADLREAEDAEAHAVAALKLFVLRVPRRVPLRYEREELLRFARTAYAQVVAVGDWADGGDIGPEALPDTASATTVRRVTVLLNSFPTVLAKATERDEPALVGRHMLELARWADALRANQAAPDHLRRAVGIVMRRCAELLNVHVPPGRR